MKARSIAVLFVVFLLGMAFLTLTGCETSQEQLGFAGTKVQANRVRTFSHGQKMEYVEFGVFNQWMTAHEGKIHLDFMASVDRGGHGYTTAYLIVYTEQ